MFVRMSCEKVQLVTKILGSILCRKKCCWTAAIQHPLRKLGKRGAAKQQSSHITAAQQTDRFLVIRCY